MRTAILSAKQVRQFFILFLLYFRKYVFAFAVQLLYVIESRLI